MPEKQDTPFQTPSPTELKQAAKDNALQKEYLSSQEATVADVPPQGEDVDQPNSSMDNKDSERLGENQTIRANVSGH
ncbi:MAG: hypothetical protein C4287_14285 [Leptolyngbya sp. ERB_1_2]